MKNYFKLFFILGGASFLFGGCLATQEDTQILKIQIAELDKTLQELQKNQADNAVQMEELIGRLTQATDNLENFEYKIDNLNSKLDNIETAVNNAQNKNVTVFPSEIYAQAKKQFEEKQYDAALQGYGLYLKTTESRGTYAEDAYLNSATIYFDKQDYQAAAIAAATLMEKFPKTSLMPNARLLYAKSILKLNKKDEAKTYLTSISQDYPKSKAAKEAKTLLKGIK